MKPALSLLLADRILLYRDHNLCISFESVHAGVSAKGTGEEWDDIVDISTSMVIVQIPTVPGACIPCEANPIGLICGCKGARKCGICYHILLVTHMILRAGGNRAEKKPKHNLTYMNSKIAGAGKGSKQPSKVTHCLLKEDSSDEEEEAVPRREVVRCIVHVSGVS